MHGEADPTDLHSSASLSGPLCFIHIQKTAGTSLEDALSRVPGIGEEWLRITSRSAAEFRFQQASMEDQALPIGVVPTFVSGHVSWAEMVDRYPGGRHITVLRDPLERLLSAYSYMRHAVNDPTRPRSAEPGAGLRRTKFEEPFEEMVRNPQSVFYAHTFSKQVVTLATDRTYEWKPTYQGSGIVEDSPHYERIAHDRLRYLTWIGLTETLDRDVQTLCAALGIGPLGPLPRRNVTDDAWRLSTDDLDAETRELLVERLQPDYRLVAAARAIAEERHAAAMDRLLSQGFDEPAASGGVTLPTSVPLDRVASNLGWHRPEGEGDGAFVWTGPGRVSIADVALPDGDRSWRIELGVVKSMAVDVSSVRLLVDGVEVPMTVMGGGPWKLVATAPTGFRPMQQGKVRVSVVVPAVSRPVDCGRGDDARLLGIAVNRLAVVPSR